VHELSICRSLLQQVESIAVERNAQCVTRIVLGIGPLSGVETVLLKNAYTTACAGTVAESAELIIKHLPVRVKCSRCGSESDALPNKLVCKQCGEWRTVLISGDELMLMSVELEKSIDPVAMH